VILLDTHAAIWIAQGHRRGRALERLPRIFLSPASLLEIQFLIEAGRLRLRPGQSIAMLIADERWRVDEPPSVEWFETASELSWTRDPFDRLLCGHARLRRWKLATADAVILSNLRATETWPL
jgi:PIN domain nuclease of toxin-antitoxin system